MGIFAGKERLASFLESLLVHTLCLGLMLWTYPSGTVRAEGVSWGGEGGQSITMEAVDANGRPIPDGLLRPGDAFDIVVQAYDSEGRPTPCTPRFGAEQGVIGTKQIESVDPATGKVTMGSDFGSAQINVQCEEFPDVKARMHVRNHPPLGAGGGEAAAEGPADASAPGLTAAKSLMHPVEAPAGAGAAAEGAAAAEASGATAAGQALLAGLLIGVAVVGGIMLGSALYNASSGGSSTCSQRACIKGFSGCSCSGSSSTSCDTSLFDIACSGESCTTSGGTRTAWCAEGLTCTNSVCSSQCS